MGQPPPQQKCPPTSPAPPRLPPRARTPLRPRAPRSPTPPPAPARPRHTRTRTHRVGLCRCAPRRRPLAKAASSTDKSSTRLVFGTIRGRPGRRRGRRARRCCSPRRAACSRFRPPAPPKRPRGPPRRRGAILDMSGFQARLWSEMQAARPQQLHPSCTIAGRRVPCEAGAPSAAQRAAPQWLRGDLSVPCARAPGAQRSPGRLGRAWVLILFRRDAPVVRAVSAASFRFPFLLPASCARPSLFGCSASPLAALLGPARRTCSCVAPGRPPA